jgi:hypothetical protein
VRNSTYLGGGSDEDGHGIAVNAEGFALVVGASRSSNFPSVDPAQAQAGRGADVFAALLRPYGSELIFSTVVGGSGLDEAYSAALDGAGRSLIVGRTSSVDYPTKNALQNSLLSQDAFFTV